MCAVHIRPGMTSEPTHLIAQERSPEARRRQAEAAHRQKPEYGARTRRRKEQPNPLAASKSSRHTQAAWPLMTGTQTQKKSTDPPRASTTAHKAPHTGLTDAPRKAQKASRQKRTTTEKENSHNTRAVDSTRAAALLP